MLKFYIQINLQCSLISTWIPAYIFSACEDTFWNIQVQLLMCLEALAIFTEFYNSWYFCSHYPNSGEYPTSSYWLGTWSDLICFTLCVVRFFKGRIYQYRWLSDVSKLIHFLHNPWGQEKLPDFKLSLGSCK